MESKGQIPYFIEEFLQITVDWIWGLPLTIFLMGSGFVFSLLLKGIQIRGFCHAIKIIFGKYSSNQDPGEIHHFQTFTTALSTTTGLGNLAGVPVAIQLGGPGAIFWMIVFGILGMALKYAECTLSIMHRLIKENKSLAGPMKYMVNGLGPSWRPLAITFAIICTIDVLTAGNLFQSNQVASLLYASYEIPHLFTGVVLALIVGFVIIGGIQRIGLVASFVVPFVGGLYVLTALSLVLINLDQIPSIIGQIISGAFTGSATTGGLSGVVVAEAFKQGVKRACFSSEAGVGISTFAHGASKTKEPVREGLVALLEPFISVVVMCHLTAFVILISGDWRVLGVEGINVTAMAFDSLLPYFGSLGLPIIVVFLVYSSLLACSYSGEMALKFFIENRKDKERWLLLYKILFCLAIIAGTLWPFHAVLNLADTIIGIMVILNLTAVWLLFPQLKKRTEDYFERLNKGAF